MIKEKELPQFDFDDLSIVFYRTSLGFKVLSKPLKFVIQLFARYEHIELFNREKLYVASGEGFQILDAKQHWLDYLFPKTKVYIFELKNNATESQKDYAEMIASRLVGRKYQASSAWFSVINPRIVESAKKFKRFVLRQPKPKTPIRFNEIYCSQAVALINSGIIPLNNIQDAAISPLDYFKIIRKSGLYKTKRRIK